MMRQHALCPTLLLLMFSVIPLLLPSVSAATLHGTVYDANLDVATDVLVTVDTRPAQRMLTPDGAYAFELPPGSYTLTVTYLKGDRNATFSEQVQVSQEGSFTYDLFLFPSLVEDESLYDDIATDFADAPADPQALPPTEPSPWPLILFFAALAAIIAFLFWLWRHLKGKFGADDGSEFVPSDAERPASESSSVQLEQALAVLKAEGGRMTQKELRKRLPYGEAKVSLLVAELEAKGRIEKIRKGRGNILVLR